MVLCPRGLHDRASVHALSQQERSAGVPKVVHPDSAHLRFAAEHGEHAVQAA